MQDVELERRVMAKAAWKLIPFLCACYMAAFLDRVNVGFAKVQMVADLGFSDFVYGAGSGIFFLGYFLFEVPSNLLLERVGARIWIARIMVVWGIISLCMMFVSTPAQFYTLRFLLGAAEAGFYPGVILYLTYWFPIAYRTRAISVFMTAAVLSSVVGSPLSGLLLQLDGTWGLRGWKWLFVVEALPSIILGVVVFFRLPRGPRQARWLAPEELAWLEARLASERGAAPAHALPLARALLNPTVLVLSAVYFANCIGGYGLDFFQPTLIHQAIPGASPFAVGLLNAIPALVAVVVMVLWGRHSDARGERRWHFALSIWAAGGGLLLASLPVPPWLALAAMALSVSGRWSGIAPFWGFTTTLLSGTAAAGAIALINSVGNLGGFAGPYLMGWLKDTTGDYATGLRLLAGLMVLGGFIVLRVRTAAEREAYPAADRKNLRSPPAASPGVSIAEK
jgi:MFS transporter, ACS family, tartrate transporter